MAKSEYQKSLKALKMRVQIALSEILERFPVDRIEPGVVIECNTLMKSDGKEVGNIKLKVTLE